MPKFDSLGTHDSASQQLNHIIEGRYARKTAPFAATHTKKIGHRLPAQPSHDAKTKEGTYESFAKRLQTRLPCARVLFLHAVCTLSTRDSRVTLCCHSLFHLCFFCRF